MSKSNNFIKKYVDDVGSMNQSILKNLKDFIDNYSSFNVNNFSYQVNTRNLESTTYEQQNANKNTFLIAKRNLYFLDISFKELIQKLNSIITEKNKSIV